MADKMIYGKNIPDFQQLIESIERLNRELNKMVWKRSLNFTPGECHKTEKLAPVTSKTKYRGPKL